VPDVCDVDRSRLVMRNDDRPEVIEERQKTYELQTRPLVDYYRRRGRLVHVNGDLDVEEVTRQIAEAIERLRSAPVGTQSGGA
jgi:adenylate kinase